MVLPVSRRQEGRIAIVTNVVRDAMDAWTGLTSLVRADGEIAWSWRPDAGVNPRVTARGDGG